MASVLIQRSFSFHFVCGRLDSLLKIHVMMLEGEQCVKHRFELAQIREAVGEEEVCHMIDHMK